MQRIVKSFGKVTCFITISLTLVGCIVIPLPEHGLLEGRGKIIESDLAFLVEGKTTREKVLLQLGEPDAVLNDGTIFVYSWAMSEGVFLGYGSVVAQIPSGQYLAIEFNPNSTLRRFKIGDNSGLSRINIKSVQELFRKETEETEIMDF